MVLPQEVVTVKTHMMAAVLYGKEQLRVEPVVVPAIDRGDMLVRVRAALTCGTDVKVFRRGYHARMIVPPAVFGHELAGDVVAGRRRSHAVSGRPARGGRQFRALPGMLLLPARPGKPVRRSACSTTARMPNTSAFPARIVEQNTYVIPDTSVTRTRRWSSRWPACCAGVEERAIRPGDTVAVIGLGPIGLMFVRLAKVYGARVIAIGRRQTQLERAATHGRRRADGCQRRSADPVGRFAI